MISADSKNGCHRCTGTARSVGLYAGNEPERPPIIARIRLRHIQTQMVNDPFDAATIAAVLVDKAARYAPPLAVEWRAVLEDEAEPLAAVSVPKSAGWALRPSRMNASA